MKKVILRNGINLFDAYPASPRFTEAPTNARQDSFYVKDTESKQTSEAIKTRHAAEKIAERLNKTVGRERYYVIGIEYNENRKNPKLPFVKSVRIASAPTIERLAALLSKHFYGSSYRIEEDPAGNYFVYNAKGFVDHIAIYPEQTRAGVKYWAFYI